ncbi:NADH-ubiquinone/plastoquinone oxidoreductase chain 6 family protein [Neorickettsia helminthoeca str. Oregon]|uniref:NADH-quinone oxidoreductase subunit J n=1 Tax=Neorickettsia helminthoeca str. Oregon TaxID=1286528 RepID=X5H378_9RICK|nr:NADH-ubiquinone/plastoquinone oxidoreductase chain 6 family protein [Neorickettsia helminthoeca str. Oregon]
MALIIYLLAFVVIFSSIRAVSCRNAVHSVLYLVLTFFTASIVLLASGAEVIAFMLLIVYVGAIAILFLFVVMMLRIDEFDLSVKFSVRKCVGCGILASAFCFWLVDSYTFQGLERPHVSIKDVGLVLYTDYVYLFHLSGVLLLFAMIAAVIITLARKKNVKRQVIREQISRSSEVRLLDVPSGKGVDY